MASGVIVGRIRYENLESDTGDAFFTLSAGVSPSAAQIVSVPHRERIPLTGTLTIEGNFGTMTFRNCALQDPQFRDDNNPRVIYTILDRRWRWAEAGGVVAARLNYRVDTTRGTVWGSGSTRPIENPRHPREIVRLLLQQLGEPSADVSAVPDMRPEEWPLCDWDYLPSRECLSDILSRLRCKLILTPQDRFRVEPEGHGAPYRLPAWETSSSDGFEGVTRPDALAFIGAKGLFETLVATEAVGKDLDQKWKPIDDLSYRPKLGWSLADFEGIDVGTDFNVSQFPAGLDKKRARLMAVALAKATVWRCYRLKSEIADGTTKIGKIDDFDVSLADPLGVLMGREKDRVTGQRVERRPYAEGEWYDEAGFSVRNTAPGTRYRNEIAIDPENRIVTFPSPVYRLGKGGIVLPARMFVRVAFHYRDRKSRQHLRYTEERRLSGPPLGAGVEGVRREDVEARIFQTFAPPAAPRGPYILKATQTNEQDVKLAADYYLKQAARAYVPDREQTFELVGLHPIPMSANIAQVTWETRGGEPSTRYSFNTEHDVAVPPYHARKRIERQADRERQA